MDREIALRVLRTHEDERRRLARELHDDVGQLLTAALPALDRGADESARGLVERPNGWQTPLAGEC